MPFAGFKRPDGRHESVEDALSHPEIYGLPRGLLRGLTVLDKRKSYCDVSVTELVDPPQKVILQGRHDYYEAPHDLVWRVFGTATHEIIRAGAGKDELVEHQITIKIGDVTVGGTLDLFTTKGVKTLYDFKTTKVYAVKEGVKTEWEQQLNLYAHLLRSQGYKVDALKLVALLKDWAAYQLKRSKSAYPPREAIELEAPLWSAKKAEAFLKERLDMWLAERNKPDDKLRPCTADETWGGRRCSNYCAPNTFCTQFRAGV